MAALVVLAMSPDQAIRIAWLRNLGTYASGIVRTCAGSELRAAAAKDSELQTLLAWLASDSQRLDDYCNRRLEGR